MDGGTSTLRNFYFSGNTGKNGYQDMHRAGGTLSFVTNCPPGTFNFGAGVLDCDTCSTGYFPQALNVADCRPQTAFTNASSQEDIENAVMFNRTISINANIQLSSEIALLSQWRDQSSLLQGVVFDGQVCT
jgi:hypothetical protein